MSVTCPGAVPMNVKACSPLLFRADAVSSMWPDPIWPHTHWKPLPGFSGSIMVISVRSLSASLVDAHPARTKKAINSVIGRVFRYYMLLVVGYIVLYPLFYMVSTAIKGERALQDVSFIWFPQYITHEWFSVAAELLNFKTSILRTLSLQIVSAAIEVISCSVAAYGFARFNFKGKKVAMFFLVLKFALLTITGLIELILILFSFFNYTYQFNFYLSIIYTFVNCSCSHYCHFCHGY